MASYKSVHRDPKSPLTPISPLPFNFELTKLSSPNPESVDEIRRFKEPVVFYSDKEKYTRHRRYTRFNIDSPKNSPKYFLRKQNLTPVPPKKLCEHVKKILKEKNMSRYMKKFEKEEIDIEVFIMMTPNDFAEVGVTDKHDIEVFGKIIKTLKEK